MPPNSLVRVRKLCLALPTATEAEAWRESTLRVRKKLCMMVRAIGKSLHHRCRTAIA